MTLTEAQRKINLDPTMRVHSIYLTLNGETGFPQGIPTVFVRLAGCPLRCSWCDTPYALKATDGGVFHISDLAREILRFETKTIMFTGGDPLVQQKNLNLLIIALRQMHAGLSIGIETGGSIIPNMSAQVNEWIIDYKMPGSGETDKMVDPLEIVQSMFSMPYRKEVIIKMVIKDETDFDYAENIIQLYEKSIHEIYQSFKSAMVPLTVFRFAMSPVYGETFAHDLAKLIMKSKHKNYIQLNLQIHKIIWPNGEHEMPLVLHKEKEEDDS